MCGMGTPGDNSIMSTLQRHAIDVLANPLTPYDQSLYDTLLRWSKTVTDTLPADIDSLHKLLLDSPTGVPGAINLCASAFQQKWATDQGGAFPLDDRQYFNTVNNFMLGKIIIQTNTIR